MDLKNLDNAYSEYIRLKNRIPGTQKCRCATCITIENYSLMDCGHFHSRKYLSIRYSELNTGPQCQTCNRFKDGMQKEFKAYLVKKYGSEAIEALSIEKNKTIKYSQSEITELCKHYRKLAKELKQK